MRSVPQRSPVALRRRRSRIAKHVHPTNGPRIRRKTCPPRHSAHRWTPGCALKMPSAGSREERRRQRPRPKTHLDRPADGTFIISIGTFTHRGGDDYIYRLAISEAAPEVSASTALIAPRSRRQTRGPQGRDQRTNGLQDEASASSKESSRRITGHSRRSPEKDGELTLQLTADSTAAPPAALHLGPQGNGRRERIPRPLLHRRHFRRQRRPPRLLRLVINSTDQLWLTVAPAPPPP
jgi:hypothetical protein